MTEPRWPTAALDPIRRARILAAAVPGGFAEVVLDVPYARAWAWLSNLETSVPAFDAQVDTLSIVGRRPDSDGVGEHVVFTATNHRVPIRFRARLEDGWCLMRAPGRAFIVVMAAAAEGSDRTRYAQLEAVPRPGGRLLRRRLTRDVRHDVDSIRTLVTRS
jgi:hypothetical protein